LALSIAFPVDQAVETARELARSWERVALFLADNKDIAARGRYSAVKPCVRVSVTHEADPVAAMAEYARRAAAAGAEIEAEIRDTFSGVHARFGAAYVEFYAWTEQVVVAVPAVSPSLVGPLAALVAEGRAT